MAREKRASPRVSYEGRTVVYVGDEQLVCKGGNLSTGGLLIFAPLTAPIGQTIRLALSLSPSQWVNIEARVVRQAQENAAVAWGLEFVRVSRDLAGVLSAYVTERLGLALEGELPEAAPPRSAAAQPAPTAPAAPASKARAPAAPGGLFSRLRSRITEAWAGEQVKPARKPEPKGTSYAIGRGASPSASPARQPSAAAPRAASAPPRAASSRRDPTRPMAAGPRKDPTRPVPAQIGGQGEPLEDVPEAVEPMLDVEDVLPHDDVLGDVEKLTGSDRRLRGLYRAALQDLVHDDDKDDK